MKPSKINVPNALSFLRIVGTVPLFVLYLQKETVLFLYVYILVGGTDFFDGMLARALNQKTEFGARLDSYADVVFYFSTIFFYFVLCRELINAYQIWIYIALVFYIIYLIYPVIKFKKTKLMHTRLLRFSAVFAYFALISAVLAAIYPEFASAASAILIITLAVSVIGFIEAILIFHLHKDVEVNETVVSIFQVRKCPPPS